jgi:hypothetical protein
MTGFASEFVGANLSDRRREQRLVRVAERCREAPDKSFPDIVPDAAEQTALYRLLRSPAVSLTAILEPHVRQTLERCAQAWQVLAIHDTTECSFSGEAREGLGPLRGNHDQGFLLHTTLAIAADGSRRPLGVLGAHTWSRDQLGRSRTPQKRPKNGADYHRQAGETESTRWWRLIDQAEERLAGVQVIHVMDREADAFHLLRDALDHGVRFVVRMARDRVLLDEDDERLGRVSEVLECCRDVVQMDVPLSRRAPKNYNAQAARDARTATVSITGTQAAIARPNYDRQSVPSLPVNLVYVRELDPPANVEPVAWVLMTNEPIDTPKQLLQVIEHYRARWMIEEFFKALKTGCAFEKRQLESYQTLTNALGIFLPIAWHLLLLRHGARATPDEPAERVLSPTQIQVLRARLPKIMPASPTAADALRAVAYLGGHFIKKPPGWLVVGRGLEKLLDLEAGWLLARGELDL